MISFQEALKRVDRNSKIPGCEESVVGDALGCVLAEDFHAPFPMPIFDNAAMDGFALCSAQTREASSERPVFLKIKGNILAGDTKRRSLEPGEAFRIMTGAPLPKNADTVLPKEAATVRGRELIIFKPMIRKHIRHRGEEIKKGRVVLSRFHRIGPASIGILTSFGVRKIKIFRKPRVSLLATGSELVKLGGPLPLGKIYDSNSMMVTAALQMMGLKPLWVKSLPDDESLLKKTVKDALKRSDVLVLMGGVSVGDYDFVKKILKELKVRKIFWGVSQKPGMPVYFGKTGKTQVFGLPGNPVSCLVCFYEYVFPLLRKSMGFKDPYLPTESVVLESALNSHREKLLFLKGRLVGGDKDRKVQALGHQGSHMISSLCEADRLIVVPPSGRVMRKNETVTTHVLP